MRAPSHKSLMAIPGMTKEKAAKVRAIIKADRETLMGLAEHYPRTSTWLRKCHNQPSPANIRLKLLNEVLETFGVEAIFNGESLVATYLNQGDPYTPTLILYASGTWRVACWGDITERVRP